MRPCLNHGRFDRDRPQQRGIIFRLPNVVALRQQLGETHSACVGLTCDVLEEKRGRVARKSEQPDEELVTNGRGKVRGTLQPCLERPSTTSGELVYPTAHVTLAHIESCFHEAASLQIFQYLIYLAEIHSPDRAEAVLELRFDPIAVHLITFEKSHYRVTYHHSRTPCLLRRTTVLASHASHPHCKAVAHSACWSFSSFELVPCCRSMKVSKAQAKLDDRHPPSRHRTGARTGWRKRRVARRNINALRKSKRVSMRRRLRRRT